MIIYTDVYRCASPCRITMRKHGKRTHAGDGDLLFMASPYHTALWQYSFHSLLYGRPLPYSHNNIPVNGHTEHVERIKEWKINDQRRHQTILLLRPRERLRSIVMSMSVCLSVCPRGYLRNQKRDLYKFFAHVAYVRGSVLLRQVDDRPHRLSARRWWRRGRSVIYDCRVMSAVNAGH